MSHYEIYLHAMAECGAIMGGHNDFINHLRKSSDLEAAFDAAGTPVSARDFIRAMFEVITGRKPHIQDAVFTFGREELIPDIFTKSSATWT
jgi:hypothetical protein